MLNKSTAQENAEQGKEQQNEESSMKIKVAKEKHNDPSHLLRFSVSFWFNHFEMHVRFSFQLAVGIDRLQAILNLVVTMGKSPSLPTLGTNLSHNMKQIVGEGGRF